MEESFRSAADVLAFLKSRSAPAKDAVSEERKRLYRQAAAVLVSLDQPELLQPVGGGGMRGEGQRALAGDLIPATGRKFEGKVMLHPDMRRAAIAELPTLEDRQKALDANPRERKGTLQRQLEYYLFNAALPLEEQPPEQLDETLQIVTWLEGALENLPSASDVRSRLTVRSFFAPFESLAGDDIFRGRRTELDQLRSYIGVLEPVALLRRLADRALKWTKPNAMPALSISGSGGVGKSALVARFMLEHSRIPAEGRIPFVYLDFDRSVLNVGEPGTLMAEMLNQLDLQFEREGYFRPLRESFVKFMGAGERQEDIDIKSYEQRVFSFIADMVGLIEHYLGPRPFVIVLDTFEEVQYRGENRAFPLWEMLDRMQHARPFLRVIVSGRAPVTSLVLDGQPPRQMVLGELDREAAIAYVQALGINDPELAQALVKQMGRIPLSLKLAVSVVKRDGVKGVQDISGKSTFWFSTSDEAIQGVLYSRILGHLHDPILERLAHPGLVLRRISPEVILKVLNEPCELGISTIDEAKELFEKLRRETSLVASDTLDGTLVHRPDLRRTMLKSLVETSPERAQQINRAAVKWYSSVTGWRAKAEELYHRLQLGELPDDKGFEHPEVHSSLQGSMSELPPTAQRYLATRAYQIDPEILAQASKEEQNAALAAQIEDLLPYGGRSVEYAWSLVESQVSSDGDASPLFCSAARVAAQQERFKEASELLRVGLNKALLARLSGQALDLLSEQAWLLRSNPDLGDLRATLNVFKEYSRRHETLLCLLQHRIQIYELTRHSESNADFLPEIADLIGRLTSDNLWFSFPLLENVVDSLPGEVLASLMALLLDTQGPFLRIEFSPLGRDAQRAMERLFEITRQPDIKEFPAAVRELCQKWPFRILKVKPPYSSDSYAVEAR